MIRIYSLTNNLTLSRNLFGTHLTNAKKNLLHLTSSNKLPHTAHLELPTNVVDINESETCRFSPLRSRDILGSVIDLYYENEPNQWGSKIDITTQMDEHVNKYDSFGAISLSSSMQSNVPSPFSGSNSHLGMPGSQWGQGFKYLSEHLHGAHYLTLRNEYREKNSKVVIGSRTMSTDSNSVTAKEKFKRAVKEYGSTVIVFHVTISLVSLASCYLLVSSGVDILEILHRFNIAEGTLSTLASSNAGTFVIAYAAHKVFAPVRIAITLSVTPFIVNYLRKMGFLKHKVMDSENK